MDRPLILDHVGIAVASLDAALPTFELLTGARGSGRERVDAQGVEVVFLGTGPGRLELLEPTSPGSPLARFLGSHGPGLHHLAYRVRDLALALRRLRERGVQTIDDEPRLGAGGHQVAFLHPRSTGRVLIELVQG